MGNPITIGQPHMQTYQGHLEGDLPEINKNRVEPVFRRIDRCYIGRYIESILPIRCKTVTLKPNTNSTRKVFKLPFVNNRLASDN